jgi:hypothetical protein
MQHKIGPEPAPLSRRKRRFGENKVFLLDGETATNVDSQWGYQG